MDQKSTYTAADIVNEFSKEDLADILYQYGELKNSRRLADTIIQNRPYSMTTELAAVIPGSYKYRMKTLAQVFQALRIAVNDELGQLEKSLPLWHKLLSPGGRLAVITFHSLEDRIVKQYFKEHGSDTYESDFKLITKRPLTASREELVFNPRARSAKLRVVQRK
jgi:16S rRNA (cytosine1402-N4)-methyltransferase